MNDRLESKLRYAHETFGRDHERLRGELLARLGEMAGPTLPARRVPFVRRLIGETAMKTTWTKLAAAAIILAVGIAGTVLLQNSATTAYAIEQTIEANKGVRSIHIKLYPPTRKGSIDEAWAEFDDYGELLRLRMEFRDTEDGPKVVVWENDKATVWMSKKNVLLTVRERSMLDKFREQMDLFDPRLALEKIYRKETEGEVVIETHEPEDKSKPITLIATSTPELGRREIYLVDQETKLVTQRDLYDLKDETYVLKVGQKYLGYNSPIEPEVFNLEVPEDAVRVDWTTGQVGIAKGDMSDGEAAAEVVRQFLEALIAEDYEKAGKLLEGVPGEWLKKKIGGTKFLRIVSIGTPSPLPTEKRYGPGATRVPCKVEVLEEGGKPMVKDFEPWVRAVYGKLGRRTIFGNF